MCVLIKNVFLTLKNSHSLSFCPRDYRKHFTRPLLVLEQDIQCNKNVLIWWKKTLVFSMRNPQFPRKLLRGYLRLAGLAFYDLWCSSENFGYFSANIHVAFWSSIFELPVQSRHG